jgi:polyhydroxyalkanoate synthesis repressor PhaR
MPDPLVLKKYSNRRLYDTRNSRYVNLDDLSTMIRSGEQVQIHDATSGDDVTAFILTQIVLEAAKCRNSLLPESVLHLIIRYGDNALGEFFEKYFLKTLQNYIATKKAFDQQFGKWLDMGMTLPRRMPEMISGASSIESMMEIFGLPKPSASKEPDSTSTNPLDNRKSEQKTKT